MLNYRTITDHVDLDELPAESVVRDSAGDLWEAWGWGTPDELAWHTPGDEKGFPTSKVKVPAIVLFEPTE